MRAPTPSEVRSILAKARELQGLSIGESATLLAVIFVPIFFVVVRSIFKGSERQRRMYAHEEEDAPSPALPPQSPSTPPASPAGPTESH